MPPANSHMTMETATIRGKHLCYVDLDPHQDQAVLLVHGHPFDHSMWEYQYPALAGFRIINPDLFGYGRSDRGAGAIYIEQQALDLALLLDQLNVEAVHLIGLSMGGQIIVEFSRLFPHRTRSLVVCASSPAAESETSYQQRMRNIDDIRDRGMEEHARSTIHQYINTDLHPPGSPVHTHLLRMMTGTSSAGAIASHKGRAERRDNREHLKRVEAPLLIVAGERDHFFPVEALRELAHANRNARFAVVEGTGHLPNMEHPEAFNALLAEHFRGV